MESPQHLQTILSFKNRPAVPIYSKAVTSKISRQLPQFSNNLLSIFGYARIAQILGIPSQKYYYELHSGQPVPYFSGTSTFEDFEVDYQHWSTPFYPLRKIPKSKSPEQDLLAIFDSFQILPTASDLKAYRKILKSSLTQTPTIISKLSTEHFKLFFDSLYRYPVHPQVNITEVLNLFETDGPNSKLQLSLTQQYLDRLGIVTFSAEDIQKYPFLDQFFWLSRFYGVPQASPEKLLDFYFRRTAQNPLTLKIVQEITEDDLIKLASSPQYLKIFLQYFLEFNEFPALSSSAWPNFGAFSENFFQESPISYFRLFYYRQFQLLPLTVQLIRSSLQKQPFSLSGSSWKFLLPILEKYSDLELASLLGVPSTEEPNRSAYCEKLAKYLSQHPAFVLIPSEAENCHNLLSISGDPFVSLSTIFIGLDQRFPETGFLCYELTDLYQSFMFNKDESGNYIFRDPQDYQRIFTETELRKISEALRRGRLGLPDLKNYADIFDEFANIAQLQTSEFYSEILKLRSFAKSSPRGSSQLMSQLFRNMFEMGMYMRQWKGPGHPYLLLAKETGTEPKVGTQEELALSEKVSEKVRERSQLLEQISKINPEIVQIFWKLPLYEKTTFGIKQQEHNLFERCSLLEKEEFCIRITSSVFAYTGAYYLKQILNEIIPGFDLGHHIQFIS